MAKPKPAVIAVIGGGPKAAAIAVKADVARRLRLADITVNIFEPHRIGAHWAGDHMMPTATRSCAHRLSATLGSPESMLQAGRIPLAQQRRAVADLMARRGADPTPHLRLRP